jgi:hypothetical protein
MANADERPKVHHTQHAASSNPWYNLATIYGEIDSGIISESILKKNLRAWNGFSCRFLLFDERKKIEVLAKCDVEQIDPWTPE